MRKPLILAFVLVIAVVLLIAKICFFSTQKATVLLSQATSCEIRTDGIYHWFTDQQIPLVCSRNGHEVGRVEFTFSPEWRPTAIFPTQDQQDLICLYETDLSIALFVIDVRHSSGPDRSVPKDFFIAGPPIIKSTTFALRRFTSEDVAHLKRYIESANNHTLHDSLVSGLPFLFSRNKEYLLTKIDHVTSPDRLPSAGEVPAVRPQ